MFLILVKREDVTLAPGPFGIFIVSSTLRRTSFDTFLAKQTGSQEF